MTRHLVSCRIAILGLGLMGGSLALGLQGRCAALLGADPDPEARRQAESLGIFDQVVLDPAVLLAGADLVVLAAPVRAILRLLDELPLYHSGPLMVVDLGSTKTEIVRRMALLPEQFDPLGGHPMCGKERGGLVNADPELYRGAAFALTPLPRSSPDVRQIMEEISRTLGAFPLWLDPETHDRWVADTSHVPYLVANVLAAITPPESAPMVGPGFRSTTRLAPSPWPVMRDILETNREQIQAGLRRFSGRIQELEHLLAAENLDDLGNFLAEGARSHERLIR